VEGSNSVTKKHHAVEYDVHVEAITFIWHFMLVVPIPAFHFHPVPVFLEFYLLGKAGSEKAVKFVFHIQKPVKTLAKKFLPLTMHSFQKNTSECFKLYFVNTVT